MSPFKKYLLEYSIKRKDELKHTELLNRVKKSAFFNLLYCGISSLLKKEPIYDLDTNNQSIFFIGGRFTNLIEETEKNSHYNCIFIPRSYKEFKKYKKKQLVLKKIIYMISLIILFKRKAHIERKLIDKIISIISLYKVKYLIISNDSLPFERTFIKAIKQNKLAQTILIQDGFFLDENISLLAHGSEADYLLTWGDYNKKIFSRLFPEKENKIISAGYPYDEFKYSHRPNIIKSVCFLGQPWENYNKDFQKIKINNILLMKRICDVLNLEFYYKPHPSESKNSLRSLSKNKIHIFTGSLIKSFESFDIFVSFTSTALLEASMSGKISLQIIEPSFSNFNLESIGYSYSRKNNEEEIRGFILEATKMSITPMVPSNLVKSHSDFLNSLFKIIN